MFSLSSMFAILMEGIQIRYVKLGEEGDRLSLSQSDSKQPQGVIVDNNIVLTNMLKYIYHISQSFAFTNCHRYT